MPAVKNILLVHGAWGDASHWRHVIPPLHAKGYRIAAVQNPLTSLADDVERTALFVDRQLIHSALVAILENACRFSPRDGKVWIETQIEEGRCIISVHDQGPGIPAEELPLVRERFYRGSNSTAVPGAGTGLYLANSLIDANGGLLDIQSTPGQGTVVSSSLPLATVTTTEFWETA